MKTITYNRTEKVEWEFLSLATIIGYKPTLKETIIKEMLVSEANEKKFTIKKVLEDVTMCEAITWEEEINNPQTEVEFLEAKMSELINNFAKQKLLEDKKRQLAEKRNEEDKALEQEVETLIKQ